MNEYISDKWILIIFFMGIGAGFLATYLLSVVLEFYRLQVIMWCGGYLWIAIALVLYYLDFVRGNGE